MLAEERGVLKQGVVGGDLGEERFHLARRGESDEQLAGAVAYAGPDVQDHARSEAGVAWVQLEPLAANFCEEFPFEDVEEFRPGADACGGVGRRAGSCDVPS